MTGDRRLRTRYFLWRPPKVHRRDAMDAADGAVRRAPLGRQELALDVVDCVVLERDAGRAALLRAPVDESVLADIEIARAGTAAPLVRLAVGELFLEVRDAGVEILEDLQRAVDGRRHLVVHLAFHGTERLEQPLAVVDDAD